MVRSVVGKAMGLSGVCAGVRKKGCEDLKMALASGSQICSTADAQFLGCGALTPFPTEVFAAH